MGLALSLALLGVLFSLPYEGNVAYVGWQFSPSPRPFHQELIDLPPVTAISDATKALERPFKDSPRNVASNETETTASFPQPKEEPPPPSRLAGYAPVLEMAEQRPEISGGLSAYYLNIKYPEAAIKAQIEGRLILAFVVETNGQVSDIQLLRSLHPLCDSAAVQALRDTRFIPGEQNGHKVRVRMRLPVQFKLLDEHEPVPPPMGGLIP